MFSIPAYPSIYSVHHKIVKGLLFNEEVEVTGKVDGSYGSIAKVNGQFYARSKGQQIHVENVGGLFKKFIECTQKLDLKDGWIYHGEVIVKNKHNALTYSRCPQNHFILFNVDRSDQDYLSYEEMAEEGKRVGLEVVPLVFRGKLANLEELQKLLDRDAYLGGCKEEGLVLKFYNQFGPDKKILAAKIVREEFRELHSKEWKKGNPGQKDVIQQLIEMYKTEARWLKSIYHLRDEGKIRGELKDIGTLIKEIQNDIEKEEKEEIKEKLWKHFSSKILRGAVVGFPEMYKDYLLKNNVNQI